MNNMKELMVEWREFVISEKDLPVNCIRREVEIEKSFEKVGDGANKKEVPKYKRITTDDCDLVRIPPRRKKIDETDKLPDKELRRRKNIRIKIAREKELSRMRDKRRESWLSGVTEDKPSCVEPSQPYHDKNGKFSSKEDATSWSLQWSKPKAGTKCGVAQVVGGSERFVGKCGRKHADGGKARIKCKDKSPAYE